MTEETWEQIEVEVLEVLDSAGLLGQLQEAETLTFKFVNRLRRLYREAANVEVDDND